jgi:hypothetical protein
MARLVSFDHLSAYQNDAARLFSRRNLQRAGCSCAHVVFSEYTYKPRASDSTRCCLIIRGLPVQSLCELEGAAGAPTVHLCCVNMRSTFAAITCEATAMRDYCLLRSAPWTPANKHEEVAQRHASPGLLPRPVSSVAPASKTIFYLFLPVHFSTAPRRHCCSEYMIHDLLAIAASMVTHATIILCHPLLLLLSCLLALLP